MIAVRVFGSSSRQGCTSFVFAARILNLVPSCLFQLEDTTTWNPCFTGQVHCLFVRGRIVSKETLSKPYSHELTSTRTLQNGGRTMVQRCLQIYRGGNLHPLIQNSHKEYCSQIRIQTIQMTRRYPSSLDANP